MTKIREILEKHATDEGYSKQSLANKEYTPWFIIDESDYDKLEKELQELMTKAVNRAFKNAEKKLYAKANREGEHTE